jgi:Ca2+-binding RTX toxin-like protein
MRPKLLAGLASLAAVALPATAAQAAAVHVDAGDGTLVVVGGPAADDLTILANDANSTVGPLDVTVSDARAPVTPQGPGSGCTPAGPRAVRCVGDGGVNARVRTGAGNDRVRLRTAPDADRLEQVSEQLGEGEDRISGTASFVTASGGRGDDVLLGGAGDDRLTGGGGRDRLDGGPGSDVLGDGDDSDRPDADVLDGGAGAFDNVDYSKRTRRVDVDLRRGGGNGQRGERDRLAGFEGVLGGSGDDRLAGTRGADYALGGGGEDVVRGRGGNDAVFASAGRFALGPGGDDAVLLEPGGGTVACGRGADLVAQVLARHRRAAGPGPLLRPDCERIEPDVLLRGPRQRLTGAFPAQPVRRRPGGRLTFSLPPVSVEGFRHHRAPGRVLLTKGRRVLDRSGLGARGRSRFTRRRVTVTLPARIAAAVHRHPVVVGLRLRLRGEPEIRWRVLVRPASRAG